MDRLSPTEPVKPHFKYKGVNLFVVAYSEKPDEIDAYKSLQSFNNSIYPVTLTKDAYSRTNAIKYPTGED